MVEIHHCYRHFFVNVFFKLFESKRVMSHIPECTNSLAFFPVTVRLVIIII